MTEQLAAEIKVKMERGGFEVSNVDIGPNAESMDGRDAVMIISDGNLQRFQVTVIQVEGGTFDE